MSQTCPPSILPAQHPFLKALQDKAEASEEEDEYELPPCGALPRSLAPAQIAAMEKDALYLGEAWKVGVGARGTWVGCRVPKGRQFRPYLSLSLHRHPRAGQGGLSWQ